MRFTVFFLAATILAACAAHRSPTPAHSADPPHTAAPARTVANAGPYANGRSIYTTGRDLQGHRITASPPPMGSACIDCHRASGAGGRHFPGGVVSADLRHKALTIDQGNRPYTVALLERAISTGVDNDGDRLSPVMPRWKMSKRDLHDVAEYVFHDLH